MTQADPNTWVENEAGLLREMRDTWCLCVSTGSTWRDQKETGACEGWRWEFGDSLTLRDGDTVSLTLREEGSVSVSVNNREVPRYVH